MKVGDLTKITDAHPTPARRGSQVEIMEITPTPFDYMVRVVEDGAWLLVYRSEVEEIKE